MGNKVELVEFVQITLQLISLRRRMAFVCLAVKAEKNKNVEFGEKTIGCAGNLKKIKSFVNRKVDCYSNSRTIGHGKNRKKRVSDFPSEYNISTTSATRGKQVSPTSFLLGVVGEKAVEFLDTLGSSMPKLSTSNGFSSGLAPRGNKISILAFEVANTINKGAILFQSLSEENIECLKNEILQTEGMKQLVSNDTKELISFIEADKREEVNAFSREVARFGNMCKHAQWHNLDRYFSELDSGVLDIKQPRIEAEKTMQELITLAKNTAELYHELNSFDRFEQDYQQKVKEMESLNLPLKGESLTIFISELKNQRKLVKSMQKKSLWSRRLEEIVEKLTDVVTYIHQAISEFLGNYVQVQPENSKGSHRLGEAGLALHYANIINQINMIASRPTSLPPNMRDTLYHGLPSNIKSALPSRLKNNDATKELSFPQVKAKMDKTLQWIAQFAKNTTKAHQGFGWVGEWANMSNNSGCNTTKEHNRIRLQTLHYADKQKVDFYILELLAQLHHLVSFVRYKHNNNYPIKPIPSNSSSHKGLDSLHFKSKMLQLISLDHRVSQISQEDRTLLEEVVSRRRTLGLSKSEDLAVTKKKEARVWCFSKSVGGSPVTRMGLENQNSIVLDIMDGLGH